MNFASKILFLLGFVCAIPSQAQTSNPAIETLYFYPSERPNTPFRKGITAPQDDHAYVYGIYLRPLMVGIKERNQIRDYIVNGVYEDLKSLLESEEWKGFKESSHISWRDFDRIPLHEFLDDVKNSQPQFKSRCLDKIGDQKPEEWDASTEFRRNADICIDVGRIVRSFKNWDEAWMKARIAGLIFHETLHHFPRKEGTGRAWDANNLYHQLVAAYMEFWLKHNQIKPNQIQVPKSFAGLRQEFRDANSSRLEPNPKTSYQCTANFREGAGSDAFRLTLLPVIQKWFGEEFKIRTSPLNFLKYEIHHPMQAPELTAIPIEMIQSRDSDLPVIFMTSFGSFSHDVEEKPKDPASVLSSWDSFKQYVHPILSETKPLVRVDQEQNLIFEISEAPHGSPSNAFLPGVFWNDVNAVGYVKCNPVTR